jgi:hypothetical protein
MLVERPLQQRASPRCPRPAAPAPPRLSGQQRLANTPHRLVEQLLREAERGAHGGDAGAPSLHLHPSTLNHGRML